MTNVLPIRLCLTPVHLGGFIANEGLRWTLGPTWYEDHRYDESFATYYDAGARSEDVYPSVVTDGARRWAESVIAKTTDYRVTGWNDAVPQLDQEHHTIGFLTMDGTSATYPIPTGDIARSVIQRLSDPNDVISVRQPGCQPAEVVVVHIPVRAIAAATHTVSRSPVANG